MTDEKKERRDDRSFEPSTATGEAAEDGLKEMGMEEIAVGGPDEENEKPSAKRPNRT